MSQFEHVTENRRTEGYSPVRNETQLRQLVDALPQGILECDVDGVITFSNLAHAKMHGYEAGDLLGRKVWDLLDDETEKDKLREYLGTLVREQPTPTPFFSTNRTRDGRVIDVQLDWNYQRDAEGKILGIASVLTDISERKKSEQEQNTVFEKSLNLICLVDIKAATFTKVNSAFCRVLGYSKEELLGRPFLDFIHPDDVEPTKRAIEQDLGDGKKVYRFGNRYRTKSGSYRWLEWTSHPNFKKGYTYALAHDITERKMAEESLQQSKSLWEALTENSPDHIMLIDMDYIIRFINHTIPELTKEQVIGRPVLDFVPSEYHRMMNESYEKVFQTRSQAKFVTRYDHQDGNCSYFEVHISSRIDDTNEFQGYINTSRNITERINAEKELQDSENRFRTIFEQAAVGAAVIHSKTGEFMQINQRYCDMVGFQLDEMVGNTFQGITHPDDLPLDLDNMDRLRNGEISEFTMEKRYMCKDGSTVWVNLTASPMWQPGEEPTTHIAIVEDITERKTVEAELKQAHDELEQRVEARTIQLQAANEQLQSEIEERINSEETLHANQRRLQLSLNATATCCWEVNLKTDEFKSQRPSVGWLGYEPEEIPTDRQWWRDRLHPDDVEISKKALQDHLEGRTSTYECQYRVRGKSGEWYWTLDRGMIVRYDSDGSPLIIAGTDTDITDRIRAEDASQEKQQQLDNLLSNVDAIILEGDPFDIYYVGGQVEEILGYPKEMWFEHPEGPVGFWSQILHPDDTDKIDSCIQAIKRGEDHSFEYRLIAKDGKPIWFYDSVMVESQDGKPVKTRSVMIDITERKLAEEALRLSEERLDLAVRGTLDGLWDWDIATGEDYWSPRFKKLLGYDEDEIEATFENFLSFLHPDDKKLAEHAIQAHFEEDHPYDIEFRLKQKNGEYSWFQSRGEAWRDETGKPSRMSGSIRDITERKTVELALQALVQVSSNQSGGSFFETMALELARVLQADYTLLGELQESTKESIRTMAVVADGKLVTNIEYELDGTPCEHVMTESVCSFVSNVANQFPKDTLLSEMGVEGYVGVPLLSSSDESLGIMVAMYRTPIVNSDFAESILQIFSARVGTEIERKRAEDQARNHLDALAHVSRLSTMGEMATGLAHELNQPLAAISVYCYAGTKALEAFQTDDSHDLKNLFKKLSEQSIRAGEIIHRLRALVRKTKSVQSAVVVSSLLDTVLGLFESEIREGGFIVEIILQHPNSKIFVDEIQIQQVLVNLIRNAFDAMRDSVDGQRRLEISTSKKADGLIEIAVCDSGKGISPENEHKIFDAFFSSKSEGMGMGLAISRSIVVAHGGTLSVTRNENRGATFRITVPTVIEAKKDQVHGKQA